MSREYINDRDVPEDVAWSLRRIADSLEVLAEQRPQRPPVVIHLPNDITAGEAKDIIRAAKAEWEAA